TIAPVERLVRGTHVSVRMEAALTDLAGNPLIAPEGPWSWESPEFCSTTAEKSVTEGSEGAPWSSELITLDADMNPVLVWTTSSPCRTYLRRWEGSAWSTSELVSSQCEQAHLRYSEETLFIAQSGPDNGVSLLQK